jgi:Helix-turn-helix domain
VDAHEVLRQDRFGDCDGVDHVPRERSTSASTAARRRLLLVVYPALAQLDRYRPSTWVTDWTKHMGELPCGPEEGPLPWKEASPMQQRLEFVVQSSKDEHSMAELCRAFGISRQTGYELLALYQAHGLDGLKPRSRAPYHHPNAIAEDVCAAVLRAKAAHPSWDPKTLQPLPDEPATIQQHWPVASTRGAILARAGLTVPRKRPRPHAPARSQPFGAVSGQRYVVRRFQGLVPHC